MKATSLACAVVIAIVGVAAAQERQRDPEDKVSVHFEDTDLTEILGYVGAELQVRFLYDEKILKRKVHLASPVDVKRKDLLVVLQSILEMQGFTLVRVGSSDASIYKVVPFQVPMTNPPSRGIMRQFRLDQLEDLPPGEELVCLVVTLQHVDARSAFIAVQGMASDPRNVQAIESANVLILTDTAQNIQRIGNVIRIMDQPRPGNLIHVVQLKHANAEEVVRGLTPLVAAAGPMDEKAPGLPGFTDTRPVLVADERTQQVIISASKDKSEQLRKLIEQLDVPSGEAGEALLSVSTCLLEVRADVLAGQDLGSADAGKLLEGLFSRGKASDGVHLIHSWTGRVLERCSVATQESQGARSRKGLSRDDSGAAGKSLQFEQELRPSLPSTTQVKLEVGLRMSIATGEQTVDLRESTTLAGRPGEWMLWAVSSPLLGTEPTVRLYFAKVEIR